MEKEMNKINVAFRKFNDGEVIAIFPSIFPVPQNSTKEVLSYMHVGQHGMASECLVNELEKVSEKEYKTLKEEMENLGYVINIL